MRMSYTNDPFISSIVALLRYFFGQFSLLAIHAAETYARQLLYKGVFNGKKWVVRFLQQFWSP
jgi:hypothetical protein